MVSIIKLVLFELSQDTTRESGAMHSREESKLLEHNQRHTNPNE